MSFKSHRLHLLGILLTTLKLLKEISLPLLISTPAFLRKFSPIWLLVTGVGIILIMLTWGFLSWYRFTYHVDNGVLVIKHGVFVRKRSTIPRERIQVIDFNQGVLHRLFKIVAVQIETAGGEKPEAVLTALSIKDANNLRLALLEPGKPASSKHKQTYEQTAELQKRLSVTDLLLFATTSGGALGLVLSMFSGALAVLDDIGPQLDWQQYFIWIQERIIPVFLLILTVFILWFLAVMGMILKYGGFTLTRTGDRIQMVYGLLQRRQVSIPIQRIQAVRVVEGVLRQPLKLVTVQVESAGYGPQSSEKAILWPLINKKELMPFLQEYLPEMAAEIPLQPLPSAARRRYILHHLMPAALPVLPALIWLPRGELSLILPALGILWGLWKFRDAGWGVQENMLAIRYRSLARATVIAPRTCIQSLSTGSSPFQRRAGLASFSFDLASKARFGLYGISTRDENYLLAWFSNKRY